MEFLNPILSPLLNLPPTLAIAVLSLLVSLIVSLAYKFFTDQKLMKELKSELKHLQKEMKKFKDHPEKFINIQKQAMEKNMKYMMHSFKASFITLIPILILFSWLNANFAYLPIEAGQEFNITAETKMDGLISMEIIPSTTIEIINASTITIDKKATWTLKGDKGSYTIRFLFNQEEIESDLIIGDEYVKPVQKLSGDLKTIKISNEKLRVKLLWFNVTWFWGYVIFSILFSTIIRKLLKIH